MGFLTSAVFWGIVIILFGLSLIIKEVFHINIPIFKIVFGLLLIYWGFRVLLSGIYKNGFSKDQDVVFGNKKFEYVETINSYDIVFGSGVIDLFKISENELSRTIKVDVVFGNGTILLNENIPTLVKMETAFGSVQAPGNSVNGFGEKVFTNATYSPEKPHLLVKASSVFGRIDIQFKKW